MNDPNWFTDEDIEESSFHNFVKEMVKDAYKSWASINQGVKRTFWIITLISLVLGCVSSFPLAWIISPIASESVESLMLFTVLALIFFVGFVMLYSTLFFTTLITIRIAMASREGIREAREEINRIQIR